MRTVAIIWLLALSAFARWPTDVFPPREHYRGSYETVQCYAVSSTFTGLIHWTSSTTWTSLTVRRIDHITDAPSTQYPISFSANYVVMQPRTNCEWEFTTNGFEEVCITNLVSTNIVFVNFTNRTPTNLVLDVVDRRAHHIWRAAQVRISEQVFWTNRDPDMVASLRRAFDYTSVSTNTIFGPSNVYEQATSAVKWANSYYRSERENLTKAFGYLAYLSKFYFCHIADRPRAVHWQDQFGPTWTYSCLDDLHDPFRTNAVYEYTSEHPRYFHRWMINVAATNRVIRYLNFAQHVVDAVTQQGVPLMTDTQLMEDIDAAYDWSAVSAYDADTWLAPSWTNATIQLRELNANRTNMVGWDFVWAAMQQMAIYGKVPAFEIHTTCGPLLSPAGMYFGPSPNHLMVSLADRVIVPMDTFLASSPVEYTRPEDVWTNDSGFVTNGELPVAGSISRLQSVAAQVATNISSAYNFRKQSEVQYIYSGEAGRWYTSYGRQETNAAGLGTDRKNTIRIQMDSVVRPTFSTDETGQAVWTGYSTNTLGTYTGRLRFYNCNVVRAWITREEEGDTRFTHLSYNKLLNEVKWSVDLTTPLATDSIGQTFFGRDYDGGVAAFDVELDYRDSFKTREIGLRDYQFPIGLFYLNNDWD